MTQPKNKVTVSGSKRGAVFSVPPTVEPSVTIGLRKTPQLEMVPLTIPAATLPSSPSPTSRPSSPSRVLSVSTPASDATNETRKKIQYALQKKEQSSKGIFTCHLSDNSSGDSYIGALKQSNQPSSSGSAVPTYVARFSETDNGKIQAEITTASGKVPPQVDENLKKCLTEVLDIFKEAEVPVVNLGGALITPAGNQRECAQTYEILRNAIGSPDDAPKSIPVLDRYSIFQSLLFCYDYETENLGPDAVNSLYITRIISNKNLRDELYNDLLKKYPNKVVPPSDNHFHLATDLFTQLNTRREEHDVKQKDKGPVPFQSTAKAKQSTVSSPVSTATDSRGMGTRPTSPSSPLLSAAVTTSSPKTPTDAVNPHGGSSSTLSKKDTASNPPSTLTSSISPAFHAPPILRSSGSTKKGQNSNPPSGGPDIMLSAGEEVKNNLSPTLNNTSA